MGRENIVHHKDLEYFEEYPAPVMQKIHAGHYTNINSTIPFFGPMLYFLIRAIGCENVLEIGMAEGYTAYYMAHAIKDNAIRYQMYGNMYYGIDIAQVERTIAKLSSEELAFKCYELDSMLLPGPLAGIKFDLIFQDGNHDKEHVVSEFKAMYPQLKGDGKGYWIAHDCFGPALEGFKEIKRMIDDGQYNMEYCQIWDVYGIAIMRKMEPDVQSAS